MEILKKRQSSKKSSTNSIEQYKTVVKYLIFVASAAKVAIGGKLLEETSKTIQRFGTAENIQTWVLTPLQLALVSNHDEFPKVIIMGGNGSGKSMLLKEVAKKRRQRNDKRVVYGFFSNAEKTLFYFQIKEELKEFGIEVVCFNNENGLDMDLLRDSYIFFDEVWNVKKLLKLLKVIDPSACRGVWVVLNAGSDHQINEEFPDFKLIKLDLGLRNTKKITEEIREAEGNTHSSTFVMNNSLNPSLKIIDHMPEGQGVITIERTDSSSFKDMFQKALSHLCKNEKALICIFDFHLNIKKILMEILSLFDEKQRPPVRPLIYLYKYGSNDSDADVEKWVVNPRAFK